MNCLPCQSITGKKRVSPGPIIFEGKYWIIEHAYPTKLVGWLVIVLKRHVEALHDLNQEEFKELLELQKRIIHIFHEFLNSEKEYIACFSEIKQFKHIHLHIIPKTKDFPHKYKGAKVFTLLKVKQENKNMRNKVIELSKKLRMKLATFSSHSMSA
jgi:diadenosine tetraphosphate (Ap4A) HIT family hydrolase